MTVSLTYDKEKSVLVKTFAVACCCMERSAAESRLGQGEVDERRSFWVVKVHEKEEEQYSFIKLLTERNDIHKHSKEIATQDSTTQSRHIYMDLYSAMSITHRALRHGSHSSTCKLHSACLDSPAAEHHRPLAGTHFTVPRRVKGWVNLGGWLHTEIKCRLRESNPDTVTHPSTNRARRRVTSLIRTTPLPLRHAAIKLFSNISLSHTSEVNDAVTGISGVSMSSLVVARRKKSHKRVIFHLFVEKPPLKRCTWKLV